MEPLVSEWSIRILHSRKRNGFNQSASGR